MYDIGVEHIPVSHAWITRKHMHKSATHAALFSEVTTIVLFEVQEDMEGTVLELQRRAAQGTHVYIQGHLRLMVCYRTRWSVSCIQGGWRSTPSLKLSENRSAAALWCDVTAGEGRSIDMDELSCRPAI